MALSFVYQHGYWTQSASSLTTASLSGLQAGDYVVINIMGKYNIFSVAPPAGWDLLATGANTGRAAGNDNGNMRAYVYGKIWEAGDTYPTFPVTSANNAVITAGAWRSTNGLYDVVSQVVPDDTVGTPIAASASMGLQANDRLVVAIAVNGDVATTSGDIVYSAPGATIGAAHNGTGNYASSVGTDMRSAASYHQVTAGAASTLNWSQAYAGTTTNLAGVIAMTRIREGVVVEPPVTADFSGWGIPI